MCANDSVSFLFVLFCFVFVVVVVAAHPQKRHNLQSDEGGFYIWKNNSVAADGKAGFTGITTYRFIR